MVRALPSAFNVQCFNQVMHDLAIVETRHEPLVRWEMIEGIAVDQIRGGSSSMRMDGEDRQIRLPAIAGSGDWRVILSAILPRAALPGSLALGYYRSP